MADTHYHHSGHHLARHRPSISQPVLAGIATVAMLGVIVIAAHALVAGPHAIGIWRYGGLLAAVVVIVMVLASMLFKAVERGGSLTAYVPRPGSLSPTGTRRHRRFTPKHRATTLTMLDGRTVAARIVDLSLSGVAVEVRLSDLEFATVARVGSRPASPVRRTAQGAVFGFAALLDPVAVDENVVL